MQFQAESALRERSEQADGRAGSAQAEPPALAAPPAAIEKPGSRQTIRRRDSTYRRLLAATDVISVMSSLWVAVVVIGGGGLRIGALAAIPGFVILAKVLRLYDRDETRLRKTTLDEMPALFQMASLSALLVLFLQAALSDRPLGEFEIFAFWVLLFALLTAGRWLARLGARQMTPPERCLLVASESDASEFKRKLDLQTINAELVGVVAPTLIGRRAQDAEFLDGPALTEHLAPFIDDLEPHRIILAAGPWAPDEILQTIDDLKRSEIKLSVLPPISRLASMSFDIDQLPGLALFGMRRFEISRSSAVVKRAFDLGISCIALAVLSPALAAIALTIKLDSRGSVFFRQQRAGQHGRHFRIFKFRSMVEDADAQRPEMTHLSDSPDLFKIANDPRVTRVGRFLRRWSLDELPQLLNVARGEMSLVGPRPLPINEDQLIQGFYRSRHDLRPGITGHWQVLGSWRIPLDDMITLDYLYVANWSLWADIRVLWRTVPYVLGRRGV